MDMKQSRFTELTKLYDQRRQQFRSRVRPYVIDVGRSGFPGFCILLLIVGAIYYAMLLRDLPAGFPAEAVAAMLLMPALAAGTIRTYLQEPDLVFLLPAEGRMAAYFRRAAAKSAPLQLLRLTAVQAVVWPLYTAGAGSGGSAAPFAAMWLLLAAMKAAHLYGSWLESQLRSPLHRSGSRVIRWLLAAGLPYLLLQSLSWPSVVFAVSAMALYPVLLRMIPHYPLHWEQLVELERRTMAAIYRFLSWFTDVSELSSSPANRRWLAVLADRLPFERAYTYHYLYLKTFARSELSGIVLRLVAVGIVAELLLSGDYAVCIAYTVVLFFAGVQLSSLGQQHRFTFWLHLYPLDPKHKTQALLLLVPRLQLAAAVLLWLPIPWVSSTYGASIYCAGCGLLLPFLYRSMKLRSKWKI